MNEVLNWERGFHDAMCVTCGCALRHPEGKGSWEEVIFNGYVIEEQP